MLLNFANCIDLDVNRELSRLQENFVIFLANKVLFLLQLNVCISFFIKELRLLAVSLYGTYHMSDFRIKCVLQLYKANSKKYRGMFEVHSLEK